MTPEELSSDNVHAIPANLEDGLEELKRISVSVEQHPKLDRLPLLVKRTVVLKNFLDAGLCAIETEIQAISTTADSTASSRPTRPLSDRTLLSTPTIE